ncbi:hypothetical protein BpHYR1_016439 [Brachionus plicatilis]|uniref:Uncharacterized protein n=1 Tax=Brachionus plicatilis TaxID=10195 RepID=A0A3M7QY25_BRAPC|nr:hypothetical protein BpHYR1_016439 [Brachionus plicatilis]
MEGLAELSKNGVGFGRRVLAVGSPFQVTREIYAEVLFRFDLFKCQSGTGFRRYHAFAAL